jgi:hypothetical protein
MTPSVPPDQTARSSAPFTSDFPRPLSTELRRLAEFAGVIDAAANSASTTLAAR